MKFLKLLFSSFLLANVLCLQSQEMVADKEVPFFELYGSEWVTNHVKAPGPPIILPEEYVIRILFEDHQNFSMPSSGGIISDYGPRGESMHTGVDLKQKLNDPIYSCFDGVVRMATTYYGYGKIVVVRHNNGLETAYAHLNNMIVKPNQKVKAGQIVGYAGRTGRATTEHLHFEVRFLYKPYNPNLFFDFAKGELKKEVFVFEPVSPQDSLPTDISAQAESSTPPPTVQKPRPTPAAPPAPRSEAPVAQEKPTQEKPVQELPSAEKTKIHTVVKGETMFSISQRYGMTVAELRTLNDIGESNVIHIGQKLKVK